MDLPVSVPDAVLGGKIPVRTPEGTVSMTIPKGSNSGKVLRLKGRGAFANGKRGDLNSRRIAQSELRQNAAVAKLFATLAPRYKDRNGGYTRIYKTGPRRGDAAEMAIIELV